MSLVRLSGPPALCVSLAELRTHLRVDGLTPDEAQDALIAGFARAAQDSIDGASGWLGRALTTQQWRLTLDAFPVTEVITLPLPPCRSVDAVTYVDTNGATQSIVGYQVYGIGGATPARLAPAYNTRWPATRCQGDAVRIDFTCGYGTHSDVPEPVRAAIMLMVGTSYGFRELPVPTDFMWTPAATNLLMPYRVW
jgi:uncharacterized phiE125 gp8 family phage protein